MLDIILGLLLLLLFGGGWLFSKPNPKFVALATRFAAMGALVVVGIVLAMSGRALLDVPVSALILWLARGWFARGMPGLSKFAAWFFGNAHSAANPKFETPWLRMTVDEEIGALDGRVLAGRFRGLCLSQLDLEQLRALLAECQAVDPQSARLLESFLDRTHGSWRERTRSSSYQEQTAYGRTNPTAMTKAEAWQVLGLEPGSSADAIRAAHRKLMMKLHPDHGGNSYLARQINAARDLLLKR